MTTKSSAKAARRPKAAKGAVLLMVLTVMFVLIFLLAGTIAVVYSARNRVMTKYEETQAYYTARSVLDTFVSEIFLDDTKTYGTGSESYEKDSTDTTKVKTLTDISYARAFELDLYRVPIKTGTLSSTHGTGIQTVTSKTDDGYSSWIDTYEAKQTDGSLKHLYEYDSHYFNMPFGTASTHTGTDWEKYYKQYTINSTIGAAYNKTSASDKIEYEVNTLDDYRTGYTGGFSSNKLADIGVKPKITIEVLERMYDIDDSVLPPSGTPSEANWLDAFAAGSRENDYFRFKVTSTVEYDGQEYSTYVIFQNKMKDPQPAKSRGLVSLSSASGRTAMGFIGGGAMINKGTVLTSQNELLASQELFLNGDYDTGNVSPAISIAANKAWFVRGTLSVGAIDTFGTKNDQGNAQAGSRFEKGSTVYANTIFGKNSDVAIGYDKQTNKTYDSSDSTHGGLNVICVNFVPRDSQFKGVYGKLICENLDMTRGEGQPVVNEEAWCNYLILDKNKAQKVDMLDGDGNIVGNAVQINSGYANSIVASGATLNVTQGVVIDGVRYVLGTLPAAYPAKTNMVAYGDTVVHHDAWDEYVNPWYTDHHDAYDETILRITGSGEPTSTVVVDSIVFSDASADTSKYVFESPSNATYIHTDYESCAAWQDVTSSSTPSGLYYNTSDDERYIKFPAGVKVHYKKDDGSYDKREYIALPTPKSVYSTYFSDTSFDNMGDFAIGGTTISYSQDTDAYNTQIGNLVSSQVRHADLDVDSNGYISFSGPYADFGAAVKTNSDHSLIAEDYVINQDFTINPSTYYGQPSGGTGTTYTNGTDPYTNVTPIAIDVRAGDVKVKLNGAGDYFGVFKVYAGNTNNKLNIIMDGAGEYVFGPTNAGAGSWIVTDAAINNGNPIKTADTFNAYILDSNGDASGNLTPAPHINYYAGKDVTQVTIEQKMSHTLEGYFFLPDSVFSMGNAPPTTTSVTVDEGGVFTNTKTSGAHELICIGSLLCQKFVGPSGVNPFVLYVPDGAGSKVSQNKAMFQWYSKLYGA